MVLSDRSIKEALESAITQVIEMVTSDDAIGWFRHCGYAVAS